MSKPSLTAEHLLQAGFSEIGCWELNDTSGLAHSIDLPKRPGVYAFAIDERVQYVGLASKSLHQRLNFYRKPGASQRTNVRLNDIIKGQIAQGSVVRILVAHPPDSEWNGFKIKGPEGLEAGLIEQFGLPWNMRGAQSPTLPSARANARIERKTDVPAKVLELVTHRPGMTELEIAKALHGPAAVQQQVNQQCRALLKKGKIKRRGSGGPGDPYTYYSG
jgi:hypothetical protein